jgi:hypothetical protein
MKPIGKAAHVMLTCSRVRADAKPTLGFSHSSTRPQALCNAAHGSSRNFRCVYYFWIIGHMDDIAWRMSSPYWQSRTCISHALANPHNTNQWNLLADSGWHLGRYTLQVFRDLSHPNNLLFRHRKLGWVAILPQFIIRIHIITEYNLPCPPHQLARHNKGNTDQESSRKARKQASRNVG